MEACAYRYRLYADSRVCWIHSTCTPSRFSFEYSSWIVIPFVPQRVVVMKDQDNKTAHEQSAQIACEAAASIRTVASLTRERDVLGIYSTSLEGPLRRSKRVAFWSNLLFATSQASAMFIIALVFWYGSQGVSKLEYSTTDFFVCVFVSDSSPRTFSETIDFLAGRNFWRRSSRERFLVRSGHLVGKGSGL